MNMNTRVKDIKMLLGQWKEDTSRIKEKLELKSTEEDRKRVRVFQEWNVCKWDYKKSAVIFNDKVIVSVEIEIVNNYDRNSIGDSESNPGCETVKVRGKIP